MIELLIDISICYIYGIKYINTIYIGQLLNSIVNRIPQANLKVTKSNVLINSCFNMSVTEMRLIKSCIAKINSLEKPCSTIEIFASEYQENFDCTNPYDELRKATDKLFERELKFTDTKTKKYGRVRWVQSAIYHEGNGSVTLEFSNTVKPHLSELGGNFTSYHLRHIKKFKSQYSIRFYELLYQHKTFGFRRFNVVRLRELFELGEKYKLFSDFRKFVLNKAVKEINKHSDLTISDLELIKSGRTITDIKFNIEVK